MRIPLAVATAAVLLASLAACGGGDTEASDSTPKMSESAAKAKLADLGVTPPDWDHYVDVTRKGMCKSDKDFGYVPALTMDSEGAVGLDQIRVGLEYVCPKRVKDWDAAVKTLDELSGKTERLCGTPVEQLSQDDRDWVEAVC